MTYGGSLKEMIDLLEKHFKVSDEEFIAYYLCRRGYNPFEVLISIIISQNTRDDLALIAFNNLKGVLGDITPNSVLNTPINVIEESLKVAGLYRRKARVIVECAKNVGELRSYADLNSLPTNDVRELLLSIKGIGYKTVDVFMLMCRGEKVFPIDTHIRRVLRRLGIVGRGDDYLRMQDIVHSLLPPDYYLKAHILLIELGRKYCKARKALCSKCPLSNLCMKKLVISDDRFKHHNTAN